MEGTSLEAFVKLRAMALQRAAEESNPLHGVGDLDLQNALTRLWRKRWSEARRRQINTQDRPDVVRKRRESTLGLVRKKRGSAQWTQGLAKYKLANPNEFTEETYARAVVACLPANMPDISRPDKTGNFVVRPQPWLTQEALDYQTIGRDNRNVFQETVTYDYDEGQPGTSKPRQNTPAWLVDTEWMDLNDFVLGEDPAPAAAPAAAPAGQ
jgi:hypothetical protein